MIVDGAKQKSSSRLPLKIRKTREQVQVNINRYDQLHKRRLFYMKVTNHRTFLISIIGAIIKNSTASSTKTDKAGQGLKLIQTVSFFYIGKKKPTQSNNIELQKT